MQAIRLVSTCTCSSPHLCCVISIDMHNERIRYFHSLLTYESLPCIASVVYTHHVCDVLSTCVQSL